MSSDPSPSIQKKDRSEPKAIPSVKKDSARISCSHPPDVGRNLVICIDGTANELGEKNTNVVELYSLLEKDDKQLTYYTSGIGTYANPPGIFSRILDLAFATNFEKIVLSAYQWLSEMYKKEDRIFIFGFSRGAYQARVLAGMIETVGLLPEGNNSQIPFAYRLYFAAAKVSSRETDSIHVGKQSQNLSKTTSLRKSGKCLSPKEKCDLFKKTLSRTDAKVHFVGAWDTVSSVGIRRRPLPETTSGMTHVCAFRHALALDELRVKFLPEYANGGAGPSKSGDGDIKEVWFAGSHSDIGGGNVDNTDLDRFGPALRWMAYEALSHGLRIEHRADQWEAPNKALEITSSMTWWWKMLEVFPLQRLSYTDRYSTKWRPHLQEPRVVLSGQKVHQSVRDGIRRNSQGPAESGLYLSPKARARIDGRQESTDWAELLKREDLVEDDVYAPAGKIIDSLESSCAKEGGPAKLPDDDVPSMLVELISYDIGRRSLTGYPGALDAISATLEAIWNRRSSGDTLGYDQGIIDTLVKALSIFPPQPDQKRISSVRIRNFLSLTTSINAKDRSTIFCNITYAPFETEGTFAWSVTFSPDNARIISGCDDGTIRVWDAKTGDAVMEPLEGHDKYVLSVAFSPDGTRIVSGSDDRTIRLWDTQTGDEVQQLEGHDNRVRSVVFSPDGTRIVSGSSDRTIRLWDAQTGDEVKQLKGHDGPVFSVSFSPDGTRIVSGSADRTIRLWDAETGEEVKQLKGHNDWVWSVAFSPDGTRIVSGSDDRTIRLWDAQTGEEVKQLNGHDNYVFSVAFSPDGIGIVSGSADRMIRLWDAQTGREVMQLKGHSRWVGSVAFSPDGTRIVSSSLDYTIRVWDAQTGEQLIGPDEESD